MVVYCDMIVFISVGLGQHCFVLFGLDDCLFI